MHNEAEQFEYIEAYTKFRPLCRHFLMHFLWYKVTVMAWCRTGDKPLSEPVMAYFQMELPKQTSVELNINYYNFHTKNAFQNVVYQMAAAIWTRPQCVKTKKYFNIKATFMLFQPGVSPPSTLLFAELLVTIVRISLYIFWIDIWFFAWGLVGTISNTINIENARMHSNFCPSQNYLRHLPDNLHEWK